MVDVQEKGNNAFEVTVRGKTETTHKVKVDPSYYQRLTDGKIELIALVEKSFEFLLEREPNTSILRSFNLSVIAEYFPEYESEMRKQLG